MNRESVVRSLFYSPIVCVCATLSLISVNSWASASFYNFSKVTGLQLNGDAAVVTTNDGPILRLTPAEWKKHGSVFSQSKVNTSNFSTYFTFRFTSPGGNGDLANCNPEAGADGMVFVIQPVSSSLGAAGGGIGFEGIPTSVGIEFDTWCNAENRDVNSNHIGIVLNGSVIHDDVDSTAIISPNFDNGNVWHAWIDYNASVLEVRVSESGDRPASPNLSKRLDIPTQLTTDSNAPITQAYIGFTSATWGNWANHDLLTWTYRDDYNPVIEPGICPTQPSFNSTTGILTIPNVNIPIERALTQFGATLEYMPSTDGQLYFRLKEAAPH